MKRACRTLSELLSVWPSFAFGIAVGIEISPTITSDFWRDRASLGAFLVGYCILSERLRKMRKRKKKEIKTPPWIGDSDPHS